MSAVSVDFIGFNEDDVLSTVEALGGDLEAMASVADQQLQSHVHFTLLARLLEEQLADAIVVDRGAGPFSPLDPERLEYMGISNGGTQGSVILACSPMYEKATLVVPGGAWTHMLQRAVQWGVVEEPFSGRPAHRVTMHMAVGDSQVANVVTEWVARSAGVPLVVPTPRDAWGLETLSVPPPGRDDVPAALFVYDEGYPPETEDNVPPATDNGAHETIRDLGAYLAQVGAFLEDGTIVQVCDGACDPD
jgi:hypothetical protein